MPILMLDNDGNEYDVNEEHFDSALKDNLEPALPYANPKTGEIVNVRKSMLSSAEKEGFVPEAVHRARKDTTHDPKVGPVEAFGRGVANLGSSGYVDSLAGAAEAAFGGAKDIGKGEFSKAFSDAPTRYDFGKKAYQIADDAAYAQQPASYGAGAVTGVAAQTALPFGAALKGASLLKTGLQGAALGGLNALGAGTDYGKEASAKDVGIGALTGLGAGVGLPLITKAAGAVPDAFRGAVRGYQAASPAGNIPIVRNIPRAYQGVKEGIQSAIQSGETENELADLVRRSVANSSDNPVAAKPLSPEMASMPEAMAVGSGKQLPSAPNAGDEYPLLADLLNPGQSEAKSYIANKAASVNPGRLSSKELEEFLSLGPQRRYEARNFDADQTAEQLLPDLISAQKSLKGRTGSTYQTLQDKASESYGGEGFTDTINSILDQKSKFDEIESLPSAVKKAMNATKEALMEGKGAPRYNLKEGAPNLGDNADNYRRLQAARETIDGELQAAKKSGEKNVVSYLDPIRKQIDETLKYSPDKVLADSMYAESRPLFKRIFGMLEYGPKGERQIDAGKIKRALGNSEFAKRLEKDVPALEAFTDKYAEQLGPQTTESLKSLVEQFNAYRGIAKDRALVQGQQYTQGPTSAAVERMQSALNKQGLSKDIFMSPAGSVNSLDDFFVTASKDIFNKSSDKITTEERNKLLKMFLWRQKNPDATRMQEQTAFGKLLKGK